MCVRVAKIVLRGVHELRPRAGEVIDVKRNKYNLGQLSDSSVRGLLETLQ